MQAPFSVSTGLNGSKRLSVSAKRTPQPLSPLQKKPHIGDCITHESHPQGTVGVVGEIAPTEMVHGGQADVVRCSFFKPACFGDFMVVSNGVVTRRRANTVSVLFGLYQRRCPCVAGEPWHQAGCGNNPYFAARFADGMAVVGGSTVLMRDEDGIERRQGQVGLREGMAAERRMGTGIGGGSNQPAAQRE